MLDENGQPKTRGLVSRGMGNIGNRLMSFGETLFSPRDKTFDTSSNKSNEGHPNESGDNVKENSGVGPDANSNGNTNFNPSTHDTPPGSFKPTITQKQAEVKSLQAQMDNLDAMTDSEVADGLVKDVIKFYIPEDKIDLK